MADTNVSAASGTTTSGTTSTTGTTGAQDAAAKGKSGELTGNTKFSNMEQLKEMSPKLYKMMMEGIASKIVHEMKDHQERLKEIMRKARNS